MRANLRRGVGAWRRRFAWVVGVMLAGGVASAFNPPVETAGPLTVRIEGPVEVGEVDVPFSVALVLENAASEAIGGEALLTGLEPWLIEPAGAVAFSAAAGGATRLEYRVVPGAGTYHAHYPLHARVRFAHGGAEHVAHPILLLEAKVPLAGPRQAARREWAPLPVRTDTRLPLWRVPVFRAACALFSGETELLPAGWTGSEPRTRASVGIERGVERGARLPAIGMHPPWFDGASGAVRIEFPLELPDAGPIRLLFAAAIRDHMPERGETPSDGITFRVRVAPFDAPDTAAGQILFDRHTAAKQWESAEVDLSAWAGRAVRLQLESDPGPARNTNCDQCYWGEPRLVVGRPPEPAAPPPLPPAAAAASELLGRVRGDGGEYEVRLWPGARGLLDAVVGFLPEAGPGLFFAGFRARAVGDDLSGPDALAALAGVFRESGPRGVTMRHQFSGASGAFDLLGRLAVEEGCLRARFWLEGAPPPRPWSVSRIEDVALGAWSETVRRVYAGPGNVLDAPETFQLPFDGHRLATAFVGFEFPSLSIVQAVEAVPDHLEVDPGARLYSLHAPEAQAFTLIPCRDVWAGVTRWREINGMTAAGGVSKLAGRFVFDLWGGEYAASADALRRSFAYGLTDAVVVWHNWQRWGYDYRLPEIYPPNPRLGDEAAFRALVATCQENGVLFSPHDNYIDFYPDAAGFTYDEIAFHADGQPVRAWLNEGRGAQSYRWRADRVRPPLERNLELIRVGFAPDSYFIDVWSSAAPYDYWTRDGAFYDRLYTRRTWGELFAWIRGYLGGAAPQISESGHDALIGWLDGAQANHLRVDADPPGGPTWMVWPIRCRDSERIPWFDAAHHDRFVLHGAGYESRYLGGLDRAEHGIYSDDYISTEVLTGHPAMVPRAFGREVVRKYWLLHDLMRALALRRIEAVAFHEGDMHRQHVRWSGGGEVWVNRGRSDWTVECATAGERGASVEPHQLPPYGFFARVPLDGGVGEARAAIERQGGRAVEWSEAPGAGFYVHARSGAGEAAGNRARAAFGPIVTDGGLRMMRDTGPSFRMVPLPESAPFTVTIPAEGPDGPDRFDVEALDADGRVAARFALEMREGECHMECRPEHFAYRLTPVRAR